LQKLFANLSLRVERFTKTKDKSKKTKVSEEDKRQKCEKEMRFEM